MTSLAKPAAPARNLEVQTPGEVLAPTPDAPEAQGAAAAEDAKPAPKEAKPRQRVREHQDFRTMRAADIDHTTLTSPVLTLDGYLCPPAPEAKK